MADIIEKGNLINELLSKFCLNELDSDWVKSIINNDFTDISDIPIEFENIHCHTNFRGLFNGAINLLREYVDSLGSDANNSNQDRRSSLSFLSTTSICEDDYENSNIYTKFWIDMTKVLSIKALMAFIFFHIFKGQRYDANEDKRELGSQTASMYFLLLSIPGSNAFRVFHPMLYLKCLNILKLTTKLNVGATSPKKGNRGSKLTQRKSSEDMFGEENEDEDAELAYLNPAEASKLIRALNILLNDFLRFTNKFSLKHSPDSLEETVSILVEITRCEIHNSQNMFLQRHSANSVTALAYNAYVALQSICSQMHGNPKKSVILVMKYILNNILMTSRGMSDLSTRALGVIRDHSVTFVKYLMIQLQEDSYEGAYILIQHLCIKVPDKAEYREKTSKSVVEILKTFPLKEYSQLINWLFKLSHNEKAGHRLFTLEVISKLLTEEERQSEPVDLQTENIEKELSDSSTTDTESVTPNETFKSVPTDHSVPAPPNRHILSHRFLLCIIFSRCRDSAATVRSKALMLLSECLSSNNPTIIESIRLIFFEKGPIVFTTPHIPENEINCESPRDEITPEMDLPNVDVVMSMLRRRALDDKVTVRKSALQVMEAIMKLNIEMISTNNLKVLVEHCRDPALLIRKQMVTSLTSLVEVYPSSNLILKTWVSGVLPLILDPEVKVQEKVVEVIDQVIFQRMNNFTDRLMTVEQKLPWKILDIITLLSFHKFLNKILMMWSKSDRMSPQIVAIAKTQVRGDFSEQSWTFLSLVSQYINIKDPTFALDYFEENFPANDEVSTYTLQQALKVVGHSMARIPRDRAEKLQETILKSITSFSVNVELISSLIDVATLVSYHLEPEEDKSQKAIERWAAPILKSCDEYLKHVLFPDTHSVLSNEEEERFFRYLYTLGEVAQLCPARVNKRMFLMTQSLIFHQNHSVKPGDIVPPPKIPSSQTQSSQAPALVSFNPTRRLKTLAVITLGKMCLQHEDQAKRIIPALGKMLDSTALPSMKINIIVVLSDMCVRYATLVDPLMPQVTACLRDPDIQVRRTTLTLLINLLQEDYLKLKGSFFYRILQCLSDEDEEIRQTVIFFMTERLLKRFPKIFLQHFIECIFHYNCYEEHESYNKFIQTKQEKDLFSLAGAKFRPERMMLYRFMLDHMLDDQRFATTQKLCQDVLGGVVDGRIQLTPSSLPMLEDTLMVLSCDEIKLAWLKSRPEDIDQPTDHAEQAEMAGIVIKKTIISQVVKRNVIENIVPILIALKNKLAEQRSPLMKQLLLYFKEIMKDYKNEVKEILAGDRQLAKEIEFDLRKLEEEEQKQRELQQKEKEQQATNEIKIAKPLSLGNSPSLTKTIHIKQITETAMESSKSGQESIAEPVEDVDNTEGGGGDGNKTKETSGSCTGTDGDEEKQGNLTKEDNSNQPSTDACAEPSLTSSVLKSRKSTNLLKQALINSQKVEHKRVSSTGLPHERKSSFTAAGAAEDLEGDEIRTTDRSVDRLLEEATTTNTKDGRETSVVGPKSSEDGNAFIAPSTKESNNELQKTSESISPQSLKTPPKKDQETIRMNLMRAISTPNPEQKVISNVTFVDQTQEISCISVNEKTNISSLLPLKEADEDHEASPTLLLHFKSPEAFAKDDQFSLLRRGSKKSLTDKFNEEGGQGKLQSEKQQKHKPKRSSGGFMESYTDREEPCTNDGSSFFGEMSDNAERVKEPSISQQEAPTEPNKSRNRKRTNSKRHKLETSFTSVPPKQIKRKPKQKREK